MNRSPGAREPASFEICDRAGRRLASSTTYADAARTLAALVATASGWEDELFLVSIAADGQELSREDVFDLLPAT
jgi:hypothetical protein